jgi:hypothetical protein
VPNQDVANGGTGERIGEVDVLFPRDAEHTSDVLVLETLDEEFRGAPLSLSHRPERTPVSIDRVILRTPGMRSLGHACEVLQIS